MYSRIIKSGYGPSYREWIKENNFSILSSRYRGIYAEMIFRKFCSGRGIIAIKINPHFEAIQQIPCQFLPKKQAKLLEKLGKIDWDFFCVERQKGYFVEVKMGTSNISQRQRKMIDKMGGIKVFLFRVFEDADIFIRRIN